jgi:beta-glucosidase/6-phospho-beta-glucosidase/beta-galactosidase
MKKIHVLGQARTGTTYLLTAIAGKMTPPVDLFYLEPFNTDRQIYSESEPKAVMSKIIADCKSDKSVIVKNVIAQIDHLERNQLLEDFLSIDFYTIAIIRRDLFQTALSRARAIMLKQHRKYTATTVTIDPIGFKSFLKQVWVNYIKMLDNHWQIAINEVVYYEDLTGDPDIDVPRLKFYNSENFGPNILHEEFPQHAPDKRATIVNYAELEVVAQQMTKTFYHPAVTIENMQIKINLPGF